MACHVLAHDLVALNLLEKPSDYSAFGFGKILSGAHHRTDIRTELTV
jgi:hypothetical protein